MAKSARTTTSAATITIDGCVFVYGPPKALLLEAHGIVLLDYCVPPEQADKLNTL